MKITEYDYELPDEKVARFPVEQRDGSKLLVWRGAGAGSELREAGGSVGRGGEISETTFRNIGGVLPRGSLLVFNNTRVVRARLVMAKSTGARVEVLCLEPCKPADYERAFAARGESEWVCMVGNAKKWKSAAVECGGLRAYRVVSEGSERGGFCGGGGGGVVEGVEGGIGDGAGSGEQRIRFEWDNDLTFGELLEQLGRVPIPPYLGRDGEECDNVRYQTVYATIEGSVAAPTAGLHFTPELIERLTGRGDSQAAGANGEVATDLAEATNIAEDDGGGGGSKAAIVSGAIETEEVTLHVGAGTFLPVKTDNALEHPMHTEHFTVRRATLEHLLEHLEEALAAGGGPVVAVGTTSVRTLESLVALGWRVAQGGSPEAERPVGQFELAKVADDFTGAKALRLLVEYLKVRELDALSASTRVMIAPGFRFRIVGGIVTNFHQPKSTLLLLVSAFLGDASPSATRSEAPTEAPEWRRIYDYALANGFRFLSYGDSSLLLR